MSKYIILDDSGVDYNLLSGFGYKYKSWLGQIVDGCESSTIKDHVIINKPFNLGGTYTAHKDSFEQVAD